MIHAGELKERATVEQLPTTDNAAGEPVAGSWTAVGDTVWAQLRPVGAIEKQRFGSVEHEVTHVIRMRWRSDVLARHRVKIGTRIFQIRGLMNVEEKDEELKLFVTETL